MALTREKLQCIEAFPFVTPGDIRGLGDELPTYIAVIADVEIADSSEIVVWWSRQQGLPTWSRVLKKILLVQPTSAAAERVFSLLDSSQHSANCAKSATFVPSSTTLDGELAGPIVEFKNVHFAYNVGVIACTHNPHCASVCVSGM